MNPSNIYKDFDEFFEEIEPKHEVRIKVLGEEYILPKELPASALLETYRAFKTGETTVSEGKQMEIAMMMLGEDNVGRWCEKGLTMLQLTEIMKWAAQNHASQGGSSSGKK